MGSLEWIRILHGLRRPFDLLTLELRVTQLHFVAICVWFRAPPLTSLPR